MTNKDASLPDKSTKWLVVALYTALIVEAATLGLLCHAAWREFMQNSRIKVHERDASAVIILTLVIFSVGGYLVTLPCLSYSAQRHSSSALVPYLVWRQLFNVMILLIVIWQALAKRNKPYPFSSSFFGIQLPLALGEIVLGTIFFTLGLKVYRKFEIFRLRQCRSETDIFNI